MPPSHQPSDKVTIKIPRPLYVKLQQIVEDSGYDSVTDLIVYVLRDLAATHDLSTTEPYTPQELEQVKQRLRHLGYL
ncbi:MAG: CopG family transcriptional regulator [candidate division WS1 bacterium]|jgi:Arc/MetJ-type ribon-helix-helix transcriptional regulator|nr:CopG family transcriptional regulator [candidate division WS1 bacterium]